jgi:primosomal protein N' (replication factor Y)
VAFLDFDQELLAPRFRAAEQALWLLVRAARLVGPRRAALGTGAGRVLLQTRVPGPRGGAGRVDGDPPR